LWRGKKILAGRSVSSIHLPAGKKSLAGAADDAIARVRVSKSGGYRQGGEEKGG